MKKNDYGSLCTEMYELLHKEAPEDELAFYLSYARPGHVDSGAVMRQRPVSRPVS